MANMIVMRHDKVKTAAALKGLQDENNRTAQEYNNNVDLQRSKDNVWLVRCDDFAAEVAATIKEADVKVKDDSILAISSVYTASPEWFKDKSKKEIMEFFEDCQKFHAARYGKIISAVVHFDETTPHMHIVSVPIIKVQAKENYYLNTQTNEEVKVNSDEYKRLKNEKDENGKKIIQRKQRKVKDEHGKPIYRTALNGAEALGHRKKMSQAQTDIANEVGAKYGLERGECRVDTQERKEHLSAQQYKLQQLAAEITQAEHNLTMIKMDTQTTETEKETAELKRNMAQQEAKEAEERAAEQKQKIEEQTKALITKIKALKKQKQELTEKVADINANLGVQKDLLQTVKDDLIEAEEKKTAAEQWMTDYNTMLQNPDSDDFKIYMNFRNKQLEDEQLEKDFADRNVHINDYLR